MHNIRGKIRNGKRIGLFWHRSFVYCEKTTKLQSFCVRQLSWDAFVSKRFAINSKYGTAKTEKQAETEQRIVCSSVLMRVGRIASNKKSLFFVVHWKQLSNFDFPTAHFTMFVNPNSMLVYLNESCILVLRKCRFRNINIPHKQK